MTQRPTTAERLDLAPHPEGGWFRRTWTSPLPVETPNGPRPAATCIHYLLRPSEKSEWHVVTSDELWLWHGPGRLELSLGGDGAEPGEGDRRGARPRRRRAGAGARRGLAGRPSAGCRGGPGVVLRVPRFRFRRLATGRIAYSVEADPSLQKQTRLPRRLLHTLPRPGVIVPFAPSLRRATVVAAAAAAIALTLSACSTPSTDSAAETARDFRP